MGLIAAVILRPWDFVPVLASLKPVTLSILAIAGWMVVSGRPVRFLSLPLSKFLVGVWAFMLLGILNPYQTAPVLDFGVKYVQFLVLFGLIGTLMCYETLIIRLSTVLSAVGLALAALTVIAYRSGDFSVDGRIEGIGEGMLSDPNDLASMLVTLLPAAYLAFTLNRSVLVRGLAAAAMAGLLAGLVLTQSRGGLIALAAVLAFYLAISRVSMFRKVATVAAVIAAGIAMAPDAVMQRYASIANAAQTDESAMSRLAVWKAGAQMTMDHPLWGVGVNNFEIVYGTRYIDRVGAGDVWRSAHNSVVEVAGELGLIGLLCWLGWMVGALWLLFRERRMWLRRDPDANDPRTRRMTACAECWMAAQIAFLSAAMFLSKAFDIATVILCGTSVAVAIMMRRRYDRTSISPNPAAL